MHGKLIISLCFILVVTSGCHIGRRTVSSINKGSDLQVILDSYREQYKNIDRLWFKKYSGELLFGGNEQKIRGHIRIVKDSLIIMSMGSTAGIEAARIYLTPDSVTILNRIRKTYYSEPLSKVKRELNILFDYRIAQDILLMHLGGLTGSLENEKVTVIKNNSGINYCFKGMNRPVYNEIFNSSLILSNACINRQYGSVHDLVYTGPGKEEKVIINMLVQDEEPGPYLLKNLVVLLYQNDTAKVQIKMDLSRASINTQFPAGKNIGTKYSRVERIQLL